VNTGQTDAASADDSLESERDPIAAGHVLARLRRENSWTLSEVSRRTGVSISTLSKIENNQSSPAYGVLTRLAEGLGIDFVELIGATPVRFASAARVITRAGTGTSYVTPMGAYEALATELAAKALQPMIVEIPVEKRRADKVRSTHRGEEFIYVLSGAVIFYMDPYAPLELGTGDSVYFDGAASHGFSARGNRPARLLSICFSGRTDIQGETTVRPSEAGTGES